MSFEQANQANLMRLKVAFMEAHSADGAFVATEFFEALHRNLPGILFSLDPSNAILTINPLGAQSLGYRVEELVGAPVLQILHESDREAILEQFGRCRQDPGHVLLGDYRKARKDGSELWVREAAVSFPFAGRMVTLVLCDDISDRKRLEHQLQEQFERLQEVDRLKTNFVNSVTHELRTPLTSIMGYAEFLEDEVGGSVSPVQRDFISQIQRGAKRLEHLLNDLLDFAKMEAGTFTLKVAPADLCTWVIDVMESLRPQADERGLRLEARLPEEPLELEMDAQRIGQVLTNLLGNALKFSPQGGTVRVSAMRLGEAIRCEFQDQGPGIAEADMPKLFQRFSQLDAGVRMGKGTGLGLSISKALVEAHGGRIGVESTPGSGSNFWFELPVTHALSSTD